MSAPGFSKIYGFIRYVNQTRERHLPDLSALDG